MVLDLTKTCITAVPYLEKLGIVIRDMLLWDSSIHNTIFRLACNTKETLEKLYVSRLFELTEIEGFQLAIGSALDVLHMMLYEFSKDISSNIPLFHQVVLSSAGKPVSVAAAVISLLSYSRNPSIQVAAARVLAMLLITTENLQPHLSGNVWFILDDHQIADLKQIFGSGLSEPFEKNEDLFISFMNVLTSAACYKPAFLVAIFSPIDAKEVKLGDSVEAKVTIGKTPNGAAESKKPRLVDGLMTYVERSNDLITSNPRVLLSFLHFMKALWQGGAQYISIMDSLKSSGKFWTHLCSCISSVAASKDVSIEKVSGTNGQSLAYKYKCQSAILEIMACDMFLDKRLLHAESLLKEASQTDKRNKNILSSEISNSDRVGARDTWSSWSEKSILGSLIKTYTSCEYDNDIFYQTKVTSSLFSVHAMVKLAKGDTGSFSVSLLEKIGRDFKNLCGQPAFSDLMVQYSHHGYSDGDELNILIINDLYYHLQGELEGRPIGPGPFKELSQYLAQSNSLQSCKREYDNEPLASTKEVYLYDVKCIRKDLGVELWDYTSWKASKGVADTMLDCMEETNSMLLVLSSKLSALRELTTVFTIFVDNSLKEDNRGTFSNQLCVSCIDHICKHIHDAVSLVASSEDSSRDVLALVEAQAELLLSLVRFLKSRLPPSTCILVLKTSASGLKILLDSKSYLASPTKTTTLLVMVLLSALEFCKTSDTGSETVGLANICMGLLPILCKCITGADHSSISLTASDLILRCFLTPNTWLPLIREHLQLRHIILELQDGKSSSSSSAVPTTTLRFLLTLARVRGGAEMLLASGFLSSLRVLFTNFCDVKSSDKTEKPQEIWGLGLAVVTAMIHSLGDSSACNDIVNDLIPYIFSEKAYVISHYLSAPESPDKNGKKRAREQNAPTSLLALKETEHTLTLMCILAKRRRSWVKATNDVDSHIRERSIHLLAFISRGGRQPGESTSKSSLLACPPMLNQDFKYSEKASFINSKHGWFALSPRCCATNSRLYAASSETSRSSTALVVKGHPFGTTNGPAPTFFSDLVAVQMYRIAFLVLKFLCIEAKGAAERAEELGFVDLAHIPELPMPDILHGLQDQAVAIICDICDKKTVDPEVQSISLILIQILEMALYLELSVLQICGIRPVLGRIDDFSKGAKMLFKVMEEQAFLKPSTKSLKQIVSLVYPGLL
ncbi:hypothetical protein LINGRAHAP2_LOCUS26122 [Linum grandiflorum]